MGLLPHLATKNFFILRDRKVDSLEHYESKEIAVSKDLTQDELALWLEYEQEHPEQTKESK